MSNTTLHDIFEYIIELSYLEQMPAMVLAVKLGEEVGEFSEAVLKECGYLEHKQLKETSIDEAADIINVLLGVLTKLHPSYSTDQLLEALTTSVVRKANKYKDLLTRNKII